MRSTRTSSAGRASARAAPRRRSGVAAAAQQKNTAEPRSIFTSVSHTASVPVRSIRIFVTVPESPHRLAPASTMAVPATTRPLRAWPGVPPRLSNASSSNMSVM